LVEDIAVAEFDILQNCFRAGVRVPTPIGRVANYLTMRFIGDGDEPAPQIREVELKDPEAVMNEIFDQYLLMYSKAHYVHGDLSEYNILWWKNKPWIIDTPQAEPVGIEYDMNKVELVLMRDITNVLRYFEQYGIYRDPESILDVFLDTYIPKNQVNYRELRRDGMELL
jgi:RIO kinase 1